MYLIISYIHVSYYRDSLTTEIIYTDILLYRDIFKSSVSVIISKASMDLSA